MYSQNIWFVGFDATPKDFSTNYCFIYIMKTFVNKNVTLIGRIKNTSTYFKMKTKIHQRGTGGYVLLPIKWLGKDMRFYIYESKYNISEIKKMLVNP